MHLLSAVYKKDEALKDRTLTFATPKALFRNVNDNIPFTIHARPSIDCYNGIFSDFGNGHYGHTTDINHLWGGGHDHCQRYKNND